MPDLETVPGAPGPSSQDTPKKFTFTGPDGTVREATPEQILAWQEAAARAAEKEKGADAKFREAAEKAKNAEARLTEAEKALQIEADMDLYRQGDEGAIRRVLTRLGESSDAIDNYLRLLRGQPTPSKGADPVKPAEVSDAEWTELKALAQTRGMTPAQLIGTLTEYVGVSAATEGRSEVADILKGVLDQRAKSGKMVPRTQQARDRLVNRVYEAVTAAVASKQCRWNQESIMQALANEMYLLDDAGPGKAAPSGGSGYMPGLDPIGPSSDTVPDFTQADDYPKMDHAKLADKVRYPNYLGQLIAARQEYRRAHGIPDGQL